MLLLIQIALLVGWYVVPAMAVLSAWIIFIPLMIFAAYMLFLAVVFALGLFATTR